MLNLKNHKVINCSVNRKPLNIVAKQKQSNKHPLKPSLPTFDPFQGIKSKIPDLVIKRVRVVEVAMGRLGLIGFSFGFGKKVFNNQTIIEQFSSDPMSIIVLALAVFIISVYPSIEKGYTYDEMMIERILGRMAMFSFTCLTLYESF
jgi:uncharacterized protein YqhQ